MSAIDEFEEAREDLEALLIEVLGAVFGEEAAPVWDTDVPTGPIVSSRLAIHDEVDAATRWSRSAPARPSRASSRPDAADG
ncbi:MAG: hypothetical protein HC767_11390, partial [Akkermansiaceae bacterium]|nr:hypothetical protein [Akkermansiaceae bacterium]